MKQRMFITASFKGGKNKQEIEHLCALIKSAGFEDFCFIRDVENYQKAFSDPAQLMKRVKEEIEKSDYLLIDMTDKPTGRAIEAGIAYALGKKVIVITKQGTQIKNPTKGIAATVIEYDNLDEIVNQLSQAVLVS
jgi:nucleoside 2-deoxyribosyltransferase